jgi:hypothetical protein
MLPEKSLHSIQQRKWLLIGALVGVALISTAALEFAATSVGYVDGLVISRTIIGAFLFNVISLLARWLTKNRGRTFLLGRFPLAIGLTKLAALATIVLLIVFAAAGFVAGGPYNGITLRALVLGVIGSTVLLMVTNGLLNAIVVVRHFQGTLAATSREQLR